MKPDTDTYSVDETKYDDFVKNISKRRTILGLVVFSVVMGIFTFIFTKNNKDFPIVLFVIIVGIIFFGAFWWGQKIWTRTLFKFRDASFEISPTEINLTSSSLELRSIPLNKIAIIDKSSKGTVLVKGSFWTKID